MRSLVRPVATLRQRCSGCVPFESTRWRELVGVTEAAGVERRPGPRGSGRQRSAAVAMHRWRRSFGWRSRCRESRRGFHRSRTLRTGARASPAPRKDRRSPCADPRRFQARRGAEGTLCRCTPRMAKNVRFDTPWPGNAIRSMANESFWHNGQVLDFMWPLSPHGILSFLSLCGMARPTGAETWTRTC